MNANVLVLGGGGILGEAWMNALLAGLEEAAGFDARRCERYVGTSAGSIVATMLVAGRPPTSRLGRLPEPPDPAESDARAPGLLGRLEAVAGAFGAAAAPLASFALNVPGGATVRRAALSRIPHGQQSLARLRDEVEQSGARWDGRLRIAAVELETGRRVVFGAPGAPDVPVATAVEASCAIPGVFTPVRARGRSYIDGGAWSPTNMDAIDAGPGDHVLCLNPTGSFRPTLGEPVGAFGPISRGIATAETLVLRRRGATVTTVNPDEHSAAALGTNLMDPSRRRSVIEAAVAQGRRLGREARRRAA